MRICKSFCTKPTQPTQLREDFELCRVWDSLVYEDDQEDEFQMGLEASGALGETQTRQILYLDLVSKTCFFLVGQFPNPSAFTLSLPWWSGKLQLLERLESWQRVLAWLRMEGLCLQKLPHKMPMKVEVERKNPRNRKPSNKSLLRRLQHAVHACQKSMPGIPNAQIHLCNLVEQICNCRYHEIVDLAHHRISS